MLKIRLQRTGRINQPTYRIVVLEHARSTKSNRIVELLGTYNPRSKERTVKADRVKYWLSVGAQASGTMHNMLVTLGIVTGHIGVNFWTMHMSQFGAAIDMLIFMRIAILRSTAVHLAARRATQEHATLHSLAHTDPLTGLLNRRGLNTTLTAALHDCAADKILAVYMLDLDGFKLVNDQFGHDVGDELLEIVASRLVATMRTGDGIARLGGDEFVVMAGGLQNDSQAKELGTKLLSAIGEPFALSQQTCRVGVTIGYALAPTDGQHAETLLKQADAAMYAGKQSGRNCLRRGISVAGQ